MTAWGLAGRPCGLMRQDAAEDAEYGREDKDGGPQVVLLHPFLHVEYRERHEDRERDRLLQYLQLAEVHDAVSDPVRGHLYQVFE